MQYAAVVRNGVRPDKRNYSAELLNEFNQQFCKSFTNGPRAKRNCFVSCAKMFLNVTCALKRVPRAKIQFTPLAVVDIAH